MAGRSRTSSSPFAWTTVLYLLLVFIAPLALLQPAHAQDEQAPLREDLGTGTLPYARDDWIYADSILVIGIDLGTTYSLVPHAGRCLSETLTSF